MLTTANGQSEEQHSIANIADQLEGQSSVNDESSSNNGTVLSITFRQHQIGAAYFELTENRLTLICQIYENESFETVSTLLYQVNPTLTLVQAKSDPNFIDTCRGVKYGEQIFLDESEYSSILPSTTPSTEGSVENPIDIRPSAEYSYQPAYAYLRQNWPQMDEAMLKANPLSVSAIGAILAWLEKNWTSPNAPILEVQWTNIKSYMQINADALRALQIFLDESHPNMHLSKGREGLSLFGIMNKCRSVMGKRLLKLWFLRPLQSPVDLNSRLDAVEWLSQDCRVHLIDKLQEQLRQMVNIRLLFSSMKTTIPSFREFVHLQKFVRSAAAIKQIFLAEASFIPDSCAVFQKCLNFDLELLMEVFKCIGETIDFEESKNQNRVVVKANIDTQLDDIRRKYYGLSDYLTSVVQEIALEFGPGSVKSLNVLYFPQLGYLVAIPNDPGASTPSTIGGKGIPADYELQFSTERVSYYKNPKMRVLDETIGDLHEDMVDIEIEILTQLYGAILKFSHILIAYANVCAELDCLISFAEFSLENNLTRPIIVPESIIRFQEGRHILQEKILEASRSFVPNDCCLGGEDEAKIAIVTGANSSGKSVYMKQVALTVYMAHLGCFVPTASGSIIGIVDKLHTRIQTRESLSRDESAFKIDLGQVKTALANFTSKSLLLIDEFGKGTLCSDGVGLFCGLIEYLARSADCPRVMAITHFHEIYKENLISSSIDIKWLTMDLMVLPNGQDDTIVFLYKVADGVAKESHAYHCARLAGIPEGVLERGRRLYENIKNFSRTLQV